MASHVFENYAVLSERKPQNIVDSSRRRKTWYILASSAFIRTISLDRMDSKQQIFYIPTAIRVKDC